MLTTLAVLVGLFAGLVVAGGFALGIRSQGMSPALGLQPDPQGGYLAPCPDSPNCVCSEVYAGRQSQHAIEPLHVDSAPDRAWAALQQAIMAEGGKIKIADEQYLHATFTSRLFRFVDDVEARRDDPAGLIQLRSASRVGRSDLGVNRKRVEAIRIRWRHILHR